MKYSTIYGIELPIKLDEDFVTPEWIHLERFYPIFKEASFGLITYKDYVIEICKALEGIRGRSRNEWFNRYIQHFGTDHFETMEEL